MSALRLTKLSPSHRANQISFCANKCRASTGSVRSNLGYSVAVYIAWMLDRPTLLCAACAKSWTGTYEGALDVERPQVAA